MDINKTQWYWQEARCYTAACCSQMCDIMDILLLSITDVSTALININEGEDKQEETGHNEMGDKGTKKDNL